MIRFFYFERRILLLQLESARYGSITSFLAHCPCYIHWKSSCWRLAFSAQLSTTNQEQRGQKALYWGAAFAVLSGVLVFFTWNFLPVLLLPIFYASAYYIAAEVKFGDALKQQSKVK